MDKDLGDPDTDKRNRNGITRCQLMMVNEDQHRGNWTRIRETSSVHGDSSCVEQSAREIVFRHGSVGRATRSRNLTEKGLAYKKKTLRERRRKINSRLIRKYSTIEDLLFSSENIIAVEEEMKQFNDLFKVLLDAHQEYNQLLGDAERGRDDDWFDDVDTHVCSFKRKVHCWLREAAQRAKSSRFSSRNSRNVSDTGSVNSKKSKDSQESRSSRISRETRSTKSTKDRDTEEKMKVAELIAEAELLQQKQIIQNEAEKLKIKERLAKAQARIQAYNNIELENGNEREQLQPKLLEDNWMRSIRMYDARRVAKIEI